CTVPKPAGPHRSLRGGATIAHGVLRARIRRGRRTHDLRPERTRHVSAGRQLHRSDPEGRTAGRPCHRAADEVRTGGQSQGRQGAWSHNPVVAAVTRGSCERVIATTGCGAHRVPLSLNVGQPEERMERMTRTARSIVVALICWLFAAIPAAGDT